MKHFLPQLLNHFISSSQFTLQQVMMVVIGCLHLTNSILKLNNLQQTKCHQDEHSIQFNYHFYRPPLSKKSITGGLCTALVKNINCMKLVTVAIIGLYYILYCIYTFI